MEEKCSSSSNSTEALEEISRRLHAGHFTSQFDAMCLASVELNDYNRSHLSTERSHTHAGTSGDTVSDATTAADNTPPSLLPQQQQQQQQLSFSTPLSMSEHQVKPLRGLQGLCSEILGVLNSAVIAEQGTLGYLQQQIEQQQQQQQDQYEQAGGAAAMTISQNKSTGNTTCMDSEWNFLPPAGDEHEHRNEGGDKGGVEDVPLHPPPPPLLLLSAPPLAVLPSSQQVLQARRAASRRRLQLLYDEVFELLAAKTRALEAVDALLGAYEDGIARLAEAAGLQHAAARAQVLSQPCLLDLLAHRFLDTTQVGLAWPAWLLAYSSGT